jgi:hypothetical protein
MRLKVLPFRSPHKGLDLLWVGTNAWDSVHHRLLIYINSGTEIHCPPYVASLPNVLFSLQVSVSDFKTEVDKFPSSFRSAIAIYRPQNTSAPYTEQIEAQTVLLRVFSIYPSALDLERGCHPLSASHGYDG